MTLLSPTLIGVIVCPKDKQPLWLIEDEEVLFNERLGISYSARGAMPVLLVEQATQLSEDEVARLKNIVANKDAAGVQRTGTQQSPK